MVKNHGPPCTVFRRPDETDGSAAPATAVGSERERDDDLRTRLLERFPCLRDVLCGMCDRGGADGCSFPRVEEKQLRSTYDRDYRPKRRDRSNVEEKETTIKTVVTNDDDYESRSVVSRYTNNNCTTAVR